MLNPATRPYRPLGGAQLLMYCHEPEILLDGPSGTGKTRAAIEKCHLICQEIPRVRVLWMRATRASLTQSVLEIFEHKVLPDGHPFLSGQSREHRSMYVYPNGSEIVLGGLDNVGRVMSTEYDIIAVFEATEIKRDDWERLSTRCRNHILPFQQMIADCNPAHPQHWLWKAYRAGKLTRIRSVHADNPTVTADYLKRLEALTGHRRARLLEGIWVAAEGLVYPSLDSCFVDAMDVPAGREIGGVDFGYTAPFVALAATVYVDDFGHDQIYVWYERYKTKALPAEHAQAMPQGVTWYYDPEDPASAIELSRAGHRMKKAMNDILIGVSAVNARVESGTLRISTQCRALRAEGQAYHYPEDKQTEKPEKEFDHAMDALRYLIMGVDRGKVARLLEAAG